MAMQFADADSFPATSLFVVEAKSPSPDEETRRNFATFSRDIVSKMSLALVVAEGGGFRGALVRAVGVALTTILPHRANFKFVNDIDMAAQLLAPHLTPGSGGAAALVKVAEEVRSKIGQIEIGTDAKPGDAKFATAKLGDIKVGDSKLREAKPGDSKIGDSKIGDSKFGRR